MSRAGAIKVIYAGAKAAGLDEEMRRDLIERETGKRSLTALTDAEVERVARAVRRASPPSAASASLKRTSDNASRQLAPAGEAGPVKKVRVAGQAHQRMIKAIWIGLYNLGALEDGGDAALDAFVERQTSHVKPVARLEWLTSGDAPSVLEALKAMAARAGWDAGQHILPDLGGGQLTARTRLLIAQWATLERLGKVAVKGRHGLNGFLRVVSGPPDRGLTQFTPAEMDAASKRLGQLVRKAKGRLSAPSPGAAPDAAPASPRRGEAQKG
jgi:phage gp16-like protein